MKKDHVEKTLYLSDLDGTLLRSDQTLSAYTCSVIGRLVRAGVHFSYATARSIDTAARVTKGMEVDIPVIVHNGAFIVDSVSRRPIWSAKLRPKKRRSSIPRSCGAGCFRSPMQSLTVQTGFPIFAPSAARRSGSLYSPASGMRTIAAEGRFSLSMRRWTGTSIILPASAIRSRLLYPSMKS